LKRQPDTKHVFEVADWPRESERPPHALRLKLIGFQTVVNPRGAGTTAIYGLALGIAGRPTSFSRTGTKFLGWVVDVFIAAPALQIG